MRLDPLVRNYPAYLDDLIGTLAAPTTRIYLDTSLLMWLIGVGAEARAEFIAWARGRPQGAVRVPVWAAHELQKHLAAATVRNNANQTIKDAIKKYDEFVGLATERAEDAGSRRHGFAGRMELLSALSLSHTQVARIARAVELEEVQFRGVTDEVIAFANEHLLQTDLSGVMRALRDVGQFRYDHRVPPGFQDNKPENRFGDLILWEEILLDMAAARRTKAGGVRKAPLASNAVFVSRDKKTDWVSAAAWLSGVQPEISRADRSVDLDVALPHPTLLHEFEQRTGAERVFITHPAFLATALDYDARRTRQPSPSRAWQAATHRLELVPQLEKRLQAVETGSAQADTPPKPPPPLVIVSWNGLTVRQLAAPDVSATVAPILRARPGEAPTATAALVAAGANGSMDGIRLGRSFAELSLARTAGWPEQLAPHLEAVLEASPEAAQLALLAFAATGVFDRYGEVRRQPDRELLQVVLGLEDDRRFGDAFRTLARLIKEQGARLPYTPGSGASVRYSVELGPAPAPFRIRSIRLGGQEVLASQLPSASERTLARLLARPPSSGCSGRELRALIAQEYLVPMEKLTSSFDAKKLTWSDDLGLQPLDASADGGVGEDLDTDDHD